MTKVVMFGVLTPCPLLEASQREHCRPGSKRTAAGFNSVAVHGKRELGGAAQRGLPTVANRQRCRVTGTPVTGRSNARPHGQAICVFFFLPSEPLSPPPLQRAALQAWVTLVLAGAHHHAAH